jgi:hypothetical protein
MDERRDDKLTAWTSHVVLQIPRTSRPTSLYFETIVDPTRRDDGVLCVFIALLGLASRTPRQTKEGVMHEDPRYFRVWIHSSAMLNRGMAGIAPPSFLHSTTNINLDSALLFADVDRCPKSGLFQDESSDVVLRRLHEAQPWFPPCRTQTVTKPSVPWINPELRTR